MMEWTVNGWIEHDGKGMPVDGDTIVAIRCRDGVEFMSHPASDFLGDGNGSKGDWWKKRFLDVDIVAYKVDEK